MIVQNLGNKNQFVISIDGKKLFQSYETVMTVIDSNNNFFCQYEHGKLQHNNSKIHAAISSTIWQGI